MCLSNKRPAILCIGEDRRLLETRGMLLRGISGCVILASSQELFTVQEEGFSLVLLCHTLSVEQYASCLAYIRERWQGAQVIRIKAMSKSFRDGPERAVTSEPALLVKELRRLLSRSA